MESNLKTVIGEKIITISENLTRKSLELLQEQWEIIQRDYDTSLKSYREREVPNLEGDRTYTQDEYLTVVLDGHMDTLVKTMLNIIVSAVTEVSLAENGTELNLPDPVEYALNNKELYNIL